MDSFDMMECFGSGWHVDGAECVDAMRGIYVMRGSIVKFLNCIRVFRVHSRLINIVHLDCGILLGVEIPRCARD